MKLRNFVGLVTLLGCVFAQAELIRHWTFEEGKWAMVDNLAPVYPGKMGLSGGRLGSLIIAHKTAYDVDYPSCYIPRQTNDQFNSFWTHGRCKGKGALALGNYYSGLWRSGLDGTEFTNGFTISGWVRLHKKPQFGKDAVAQLMKLGDAYNDGFRIEISKYGWQPRGGIFAGFSTSANEHYAVASEFLPGVWHHFACTWNKSILRLYVDGACLSSTNMPNCFKPIQHSDTWMGCCMFGESCVPGHFIVGGKGSAYLDVDELSVYTHTLSAAEVKAQASSTVENLPEEEPPAPPITIPTSSGGYFRIGEKIPVTAHGTVRVKVTTLDGEHIAERTLKDETWQLQLSRCGVYYIDAPGLFEPYCVGVVPPKPAHVDSPFGLWATEDLFCHDTNRQRCFMYMDDKDLEKPDADKFVRQHFLRFKNMALERQHIAPDDWHGMTIVPFDTDGLSRKPITNERMKVLREKWRYCIKLAQEAGVKDFECTSEINGNLSPEGYVQQLRELVPMIRAAIPDAKIYPPGATPNAVPYIARILDLLGADAEKLIDGVSIHPYVGDPIYAYHFDSIGKKLLEVVGSRKLKIYNTESGISMLRRVQGRPMTTAEADRTPLPVSKHGAHTGYMTSIIEYPEAMAAALQVQGIIMDFATGFETYYKCQHSCEGAYPSLQSVAITALSGQVINHMVGHPRLIKTPSTTSVAAMITRRDSNRVLAVFASRPETLNFRLVPNTTLRTMDLYGNYSTLKVPPSGIITVRADLAAQYFFNVPEQVECVCALSLEVPSKLNEKGELTGTLTITNPFTEKFTGTLKAEPIRGATITLGEQEVTLAPGETRKVSVSLKAQTLKRRNYSLAVTLGDFARAEKVFASEGLVYEAPPWAGDWAKVNALVAEDEESLVLGKPDRARNWVPQWRGAYDLAVTARVAYERGKVIRFRLDVTDQQYTPAPLGKEGESFRYDGLELFVDTRQASALGAPVADGADQILVAPPVALSTVPQQCRIVKCRGETNARVDVECTACKTDKGYILEGRITPRANAQLRVLPGSHLGLDFLVDDADGVDKLRKAAMAIHGDLSDNTNAVIWGRYELGL